MSNLKISIVSCDIRKQSNSICKSLLLAMNNIWDNYKWHHRNSFSVKLKHIIQAIFPCIVFKLNIQSLVPTEWVVGITKLFLVICAHLFLIQVHWLSSFESRRSQGHMQFFPFNLLYMFIFLVLPCYYDIIQFSY